MAAASPSPSSPLPSAARAALAQAPDPALVERGEYVARAGDCTSCHTAAGAGSAPFAGGYDIPSPMGPIVSSNITPSKTHGIGGYSLDDFARAVRKGVAPERHAPLSGDALYGLCGRLRRRHRRALRVFHAQGRTGRHVAARDHAALPLQPPGADDRLEPALCRARLHGPRPAPRRRSSAASTWSRRSAIAAPATVRGT